MWGDEGLDAVARATVDRFPGHDTAIARERLSNKISDMQG